MGRGGGGSLLLTPHPVTKYLISQLIRVQMFKKGTGSRDSILKKIDNSGSMEDPIVS